VNKMLECHLPRTDRFMFMAASVFCLALVVLVIYRAEARIGDTWRRKNDELQIQLQQ